MSRSFSKDIGYDRQGWWKRFKDKVLPSKDSHIKKHQISSPIVPFWAPEPGRPVRSLRQIRLDPRLMPTHLYGNDERNDIFSDEEPYGRPYYATQVRRPDRERHRIDPRIFRDNSSHDDKWGTKDPMLSTPSSTYSQDSPCSGVADRWLRSHSPTSPQSIVANRWLRSHSAASSQSIHSVQNNDENDDHASGESAYDDDGPTEARNEDMPPTVPPKDKPLTLKLPSARTPWASVQRISPAPTAFHESSDTPPRSVAPSSICWLEAERRADQNASCISIRTSTSPDSSRRHARQFFTSVKAAILDNDSRSSILSAHQQTSRNNLPDDFRASSISIAEVQLSPETSISIHQEGPYTLSTDKPLPSIDADGLRHKEHPECEPSCPVINSGLPPLLGERKSSTHSLSMIKQDSLARLYDPVVLSATELTLRETTSTRSPSIHSVAEDVDELQDWLDDNLDHPNRQAHIKRLLDTSHREGRLPESLFITGLRIRGDGVPVAGGSFSDVFKGMYREQEVAIKRYRFFVALTAKEKLHKRFCREALIWRQLRHPRILGFLGVDRAAFLAGSSLIIAAPWMKQGTLMEYLQNSNGTSIPHKSLMVDVATGLSYLHEQMIAHGDLHGSNVYVDEHGRAVLGDFGLTAITDAAYQVATTTINKNGASRWLSPELIYQGNGIPPRKSMSGDIFAFGRLCLSVFTRRVPFQDIAADPGVILMVITHRHPTRPDQNACFGSPMPDGLWHLIVRCWNANAAERPSIFNITHIVDSIEF